MLINLSNHKSSDWNQNQLNSAQEIYGGVIDISFPQIDPDAAGEDVYTTAQEFLLTIKNILNDLPIERSAVNVVGEFTFVYALVKLLEKESIQAVAPTSIRKTTQKGSQKISEFVFVQFREYF